MANGNGNGNGSFFAITPVKTIGICLTITLGINTFTLTELNNRTDERYRLSDNARDHALVDFRFTRNELRMSNIEASDKECIARISSHLENHGHAETR